MLVALRRQVRQRGIGMQETAVRVDVYRLLQHFEGTALVVGDQGCLALAQWRLRRRLEVRDVLSGLECTLPGGWLAAVNGGVVFSASGRAVQASSIRLRGASGGEAEDLRPSRLLLACISQHFTWSLASHLVPRAGGAGARLRLLRPRLYRYTPAVDILLALDVALRAQEQLHAYLACFLLVSFESLQCFVSIHRWLMRKSGRQLHHRSAVLRRLEGVRLGGPAAGILGLRLADQRVLHW